MSSPQPSSNVGASGKSNGNNRNGRRNNRGRGGRSGKRSPADNNAVSSAMTDAAPTTSTNKAPSSRSKRAKTDTNNNNICFQFRDSGSCSRGDQCRFVHKISKKNEDDKDVVMEESAAPTVAPASTSEGPSQKAHITDKRFDQLEISKESKQAMNSVFRYEFMTVVQAETLPSILKGEDCLAKAKTGTGKTLGFLIPAVERLLHHRNKANDIGCLCLSPTRELALQISKEAESLTTFHGQLNVATFVGGTNINKDFNALKKSIQILVSTPGRLLDHLQNQTLASRLTKLQVLILDEADQLLDMGFRPDILRILKCLDPSRATRQTLLFSATVPSSVEEFAKFALQPKYSFIDTVGDDEDQTHLHVKQELMVVPQSDIIASIESIIAHEIAQSQNKYKIIIFFTTARQTGFMADLFNKAGIVEVLEIHSRKSQSVRKKASDTFRDAKRAVLFSSDVSARGMDYPDVTFVLQVGLTDRAQYIHRLGRTARAGKEGRGALLLSTYEESFMRKELGDMPLEKQAVPINDGKPSNIQDALDLVPKDKALKESAEQAYRAWLGYYNGHLRKVQWDKKQLVVEANLWAKEAGLKEQPSLMKKTVGKMGLKNVPGLKIE